MADEEKEETIHPVVDPAYIMGFEVKHYTERSPEELEKEGFSKEAIAYAKQRLSDIGLGFKGEAPKKSAHPDGDPLPDGFPYLDKLKAKGIVTIQQVRSLSDESILGGGIGPKALEQIRAAAG